MRMLKSSMLPVLLLAVMDAPVFPQGQTVVPARGTLADPRIRDQDDMCIWIHPGNAASSIVVTSDKAAGRLFVYDLDGTTLQVIRVPGGQPGNIDVRYGFHLQGIATDIIGVNERHTSKLLFYRVDPEKRTLERIDDGTIDTAPRNYGMSLYRSPVSRKYYAFSSTKDGVIEQFELTDHSGRIGARRVRAWDLGGITEGSVCDDENGVVYFAEEDVALWKFGAEPGAGTVGTRVATVGDSSGIVADIEGLTLYYAADGRGYLIASSQGNSTFKVYERQAPHRFVSSFAVATVRETDGIDVTNVSLGPAFPKGMFVLHNGRPSHTTVELCAFEDLGLQVDTKYWNPRARAAGGPAMSERD